MCYQINKLKLKIHNIHLLSIYFCFRNSNLFTFMFNLSVMTELDEDDEGDDGGHQDPNHHRNQPAVSRLREHLGFLC